MSFQPADELSLFVFSIFCAVMMGGILLAFRKGGVGIATYLCFGAYLLAVSALVISGVMREHVIPAVPIFFGSLLLFTAYLAFSSAGTRIAGAFSVATLVGFQGFRLPLELILHRWAERGTIPQTMTWTGQNFDVVTGVLALLLMPVASRSRAAAWCFEIIGFGLLLNVLRVVIFSSPFPFSWSLENPLQLALYFPYVLIGPLFVAPAFFAHLVLARKLLGRQG